ncbi:MAG: DUF4252 domain-containing protein [Bacteroidaceae bacterium]|nr:DUF4252 domain-containing protein [Bacteroidaceae bacterium]
MKSIRLSLLLALLLAATPAFSQQALFDKYEDAHDITTVYVSKTLLRLAMGQSGQLGQFRSVAGKIDQIRILTTENKQAIARVRQEALAYYKKNRYEVAMKVNEGSERVTIYQRKLRGGRNEFCLLAEEPGELSIINIEGALTLEDVQGTVAPKGKK